MGGGTGKWGSTLFMPSWQSLAVGLPHVDLLLGQKQQDTQAQQMLSSLQLQRQQSQLQSQIEEEQPKPPETPKPPSTQAYYGKSLLQAQEEEDY